MPSIDFTPTISETYKRFRASLNGYVYDITDAALPNEKNLLIKGVDFTAGTSVQLRDDYTDKILGYSQANASGEMFWGFSPKLHEFYAIRAIDTSTSETTNTLSIRQYNLHNFLYLSSTKCVDALQNLGQIKQDIYIKPRVGDVTDSRFKTEKDAYTSSIYSLKDKVTFPFLPLSYFSETKNKEDMVQSCVWASERGGVFSSVFLLDEIFSGIGVESVFVSLWEDFRWWDLDSNFLPWISSDTTITLPALRKKRHPTDWHYIAGSTDKVIDLTSVIASGTNYVWLYVDGDEDINNTLTVKTSTTQPFPINRKLTKRIQAIDVQQDNAAGTVTGIPYQLYVELEILAISARKEDSIISVYEGTGAGASEISVDDCTLVSREILALGQCNIDDDIYVTYNAYYEPFILCGVKLNENRHAYELTRVFNYPGAFRVWGDEDLSTVAVYVKFKDWKYVTANEVASVKSVLHALLPVTSQFILMISFLDEDAVVPEYSPSWSNFYKGFATAEYVQPLSITETNIALLSIGVL